MKIKSNLGWKLQLLTALVLSFLVVGSACAEGYTEVSPTTANTSRESVRLMLFGFVMGVSAILLYLAVFKPAARAAVTRLLSKILRKVIPHNSDLPPFLHDTTRAANHTGLLSDSISAPQFEETVEIAKTISLDDL